MASKEPIMKCPHCHRDFKEWNYMPTVYKCKICGLVYCDSCSAHAGVCPKCEGTRVDSDDYYCYETYEVIQASYHSIEDYYREHESYKYSKDYGIDKIGNRYYNRY